MISAIDTLEQKEDSSVQKALDLLKAIVKDFQCSICLEQLTNTKANPECLHRICDDCILLNESLRKCNTECSSCRAHIPTKMTLRKDKQFDNIVSDLLPYMLYLSIRHALLTFNSLDTL